MWACQLLGRQCPGSQHRTPFPAPTPPSNHALPSLSAVQVLGSTLRGSLSPAKDQDQAGCDLGTGISRRQFSRPWSGALPTGIPVTTQRLQHQAISSASASPGGPACTVSRAAGPLGEGTEHWTCHGRAGHLWVAPLGLGQPVSATNLEARSVGCDEGDWPQAWGQDTQLQLCERCRHPASSTGQPRGPDVAGLPSLLKEGKRQRRPVG